MKQVPERKKSVTIKYEIKKCIDSKQICLTEFENIINSHPRTTEDLVKRAIKFQYQKLGRLGSDKLKNIGFSESDIEKILIDLPYDDLGFALLPEWLLDFLNDYWTPLNPRYVVYFENDSNWSHDFVVAYETYSGLIYTVETTARPWGRAAIHCAPCWDMFRYAWSVWNPDDNTEIGRTPTYTVEEINAEESVYRPCEDIWEVRISYE